MRSGMASRQLKLIVSLLSWWTVLVSPVIWYSLFADLVGFAVQSSGVLSMPSSPSINAYLTFLHYCLGLHVLCHWKGPFMFNKYMEVRSIKAQIRKLESGCLYITFFSLYRWGPMCSILTLNSPGPWSWSVSFIPAQPVCYFICSHYQEGVGLLGCVGWTLFAHDANIQGRFLGGRELLLNG